MCLCVVEYGPLPRRSEMPLKKRGGIKVSDDFPKLSGISSHCGCPPPTFKFIKEHFQCYQMGCFRFLHRHRKIQTNSSKTGFLLLQHITAYTSDRS